MNHTDTVTSSAGDASAFNKVVHIGDPWPRTAANTRIPGNGERVDRITKRYLAGPGASSPSTSTNSASAVSDKASGSDSSAGSSNSKVSQ
jgi:hypothetical protein